MGRIRQKKPLLIQIPAVYVWAAGQLAKAQGVSADLQLVQAIFKNSLLRIQKVQHWKMPRELNFSRQLKKSLNQGVIPFVRDDLDLSLAIVVFGGGAEFLLRSEKSHVDCGFLRASDKEITYVDTVTNMIRSDSHLDELLSTSDKANLMLTLEGLATEPTFYQSALDDEYLLRVSGKRSAFSASEGKLICSISLWNSHQNIQTGTGTGTGMSSLSRSLGQAELQRRGNALYLQDLSAQVKLELTAASLVGQWLLIESQAFKSFGALPDLTMDDDQRKVAVDPMPLIKKFTLGKMPHVYADQDVARHFSKMYPWFVPGDSKTWLESIHQ
jgi:hypothetical protein